MVVALGVVVIGSTSIARAQETLVTVRTLADKRLTELPGGALAWRVERFPNRSDAEAAAGPTGLVAETGGVVYLVTLLGDGASPARGGMLAEIPSLVRPVAPEYLLRISELTGPPGSQSPVHNHPGIESYYVAEGELQFRSPAGVTTVLAGQGAAGVPGDTAVQATSSGPGNLRGLVLFAVDANRPLTSPASLPIAAPSFDPTLVILLVAALAIAGIWAAYFVSLRRGSASPLPQRGKGRGGA
jgi:hypothetical protein